MVDSTFRRLRRPVVTVALAGLALTAGCGGDTTASDPSSAASAPAPAPTTGGTAAGEPTTTAGGDADGTSATPGSQAPTTAQPATAVPASGPLADEAAASISLNVVGADRTVALAEVAAADRPTLLWFWAPH